MGDSRTGVAGQTPTTGDTPGLRPTYRRAWAAYSRRWGATALGLLVILAGAAVVVAHSESSGASVRLVSVGYSAAAIAIDGRAGRVLVLNRNADGNGSPLGRGSVSVLDARSGAVLRTTTVGTLPGSIAVDERAGRVVVTNPRDGSVSVLDVSNGTLLQTIHVPGTIGALGAMAMDEQSGRAFVVNTSDGTVGVLDTRRGLLVRTVRVPAAIALYGANVSIAVDAGRNRIFIGRNSIGVTQAFGLPLHTGIVSVLDGRDGAYLYTMTVNQDVDHVAVDMTTGHVVTTSAAGVSVLDAGSGRILRAVSLDATFAQPVLDTRSGRAFIAGTSGGVYVFDARHGRVLGRGLGAPAGITALAVDERRGRLLICTAGEVRVLDAKSMALLRSVPVQGCDGGLALDEAAGRAFALSSGGMDIVSDPWSWLPSWARRWLPFLAATAPQRRLVRGSVHIVDGV